MTQKKPSFEQLLHIETQQYLAKSSRWLGILSLILGSVVLIFKQINSPETSAWLTSISTLPLIFVSIYASFKTFPIDKMGKTKSYSCYYRFTFVLLVCWLLLCYMLLAVTPGSQEAVAPDAQEKVETVLHLLIFAFTVALFPKRNLLLFAVVILCLYIAIVRVYSFSDEVFFPTLRLFCFLGVVISGQQVMEKWFRKAVFRDAENQSLMNELNQLALTDGLTKLSNRRHFDQILKQEIQHCERTGSPLAVIILDIDYFKKLNDYIGHQGGDECLVTISAMLKRQAKRPKDVCARYGGEEFIYLLPETDLKGALEVAEKIKSELSFLAISHPDSLVNEFVTVSQGIAMWEKGAHGDQLVKLADDKLYEVKAQSRNNIAF